MPRRRAVREETNNFIQDTAALLRHTFDDVRPEWDVSHQTQDSLGRDFYRPRIDVAVGPFNTDTQRDRNVEIIGTAYSAHSRFFTNLKREALNYPPYLSVNEDWTPKVACNENPRCLMAIEVENSPPSEKHKMGSILNAAAIGFVGVVVGWSTDEADSLASVQCYLDFLVMHNKTGRMQDAIVIDRSRFTEVLQVEANVRETENTTPLNPQ
jgi:hypothetical protein